MNPDLGPLPIRTPGERAMDYRDRHVVVTGGTGALGIAVVRGGG